ncbi:Mfa1 family fimbria major subunit [Bacteroides sp. 519]|uniref:Mfa1 family fimbria major subunit n=1 Tax=Bacteroides sp. 519 TaxID=2302937 RepID=UPI001940247F|nr:Mfa1 family fimbria major subunit [Bacteroides sp. 519]NDV59497.1 hypothetical protein [Bacteroides sp. 519]
MKIKFKYAILSAALAVGMASCSDDPNVEVPTTSEGELTYFAMDFLFGNNDATRGKATGETPDDEKETPGTVEESTIKTISIFVFDKQTGSITPPPDPTDPSTKGNYYHLNVDGVDAWQRMDPNDPTKPLLTEHNELCYQTKKLPVLSGEKEIYVGVNLIPQIAGDVANHGLNGIKNIAHKSRVELLSEDYFFSMFTKSPTYKTFEAKVDAKDVGPNGKNYAVCYVERMVAKVQVREDIKSKTGGWATVAKSKADTDAIGKVKAEGMTWHVGNANTQLYAMANSSPASLYSNMDPNWSKDGWVYDTPAHEWVAGSTAEPYYYAATTTRKDAPGHPLFGQWTYDETHFYHFFDFPNTYADWRKIHNIEEYKDKHPGFGTGLTDAPKRRDTIQYVMENTSEFAMRGTNTYASIKTVFIPRYFQEAPATESAEYKNTTPGTFFMVQDKDGNCFYYKTSKAAYDHVAVKANRDNLRTISYLTEADAPGDTKAVADATDLVQCQANQYFNAYVLTYDKGECYYRLYFGKKNVYNVARNTYYKATITAFIGRPGHNTPEVPEPEDPWPIDLEDGYCQFEIKVLPWTVYYDDYKLEY